jgi:hypothetical protein
MIRLTKSKRRDITGTGHGQNEKSTQNFSKPEEKGKYAIFREE